MRLSILCVRDYLSIFYSGLFHGSSVLGNPFPWASPACGKPELQLIYCGFSLIPAFSSHELLMEVRIM